MKLCCSIVLAEAASYQYLAIAVTHFISAVVGKTLGVSGRTVLGAACSKPVSSGSPGPGSWHVGVSVLVQHQVGLPPRFIEDP